MVEQAEGFSEFREPHMLFGNVFRELDGALFMGGVGFDHTDDFVDHVALRTMLVLIILRVVFGQVAVEPHLGLAILIDANVILNNVKVTNHGK